MINSNIITILFFIVAFEAFATNETQSFDSYRPNNINDTKWMSLKSAVEEAKLLPSPYGFGGVNSQFGKSLAIDGNRVVIGAPNTLNHGVAYILDFNGVTWEESSRLIPSDSSFVEKFGISVSISGNRVLIGAIHDNNQNLGAAYIYELIDNIWVETKILASDGEFNDSFGFSTSIDQDRFVVGAPSNDGAGIQHGSVYIFNLIGSDWIETKIVASDGANFDQFGSSLNLSGDRIVVGALNDNNAIGSAYVFDFINGEWSETKITASDGVTNDKFGISVSQSGNRLLIGASQFSDFGSAYVFDLVQGNWIETILTASDGTQYNEFGISVSLNGDMALVGSQRDSTGGLPVSGSAYIFEFKDNNWIETKLKANEGTSEAYFGNSVDLNGSHILVGAFGDSKNGRGYGSAYVFNFTKDAWNETRLNSGDGSGGDRFGYSVSLLGDRALIGAYNDNEAGLYSGSAYIFDNIGTSWTKVKLLPSDGVSGAEFGYSVSLSANRALIGAPGDNENGSFSGAAYIFDLIEGSWVETKLTASDGSALDEFGHSLSLFNNRALVGAWKNDDNGPDSGSAYVYEFVDGIWVETKIVPSDNTYDDFFGNAVSIYNDQLLIGAFKDGFGSAYKYHLINNSWIETKLTASDSIPGSRFGATVSLYEDRALIGAFNNNVGSAYIFDFIGTNWVETKLTASDGIGFDQFGSSLSLEGDRILIGTNNNILDVPGSVYLYNLMDGNWIETKLFAIDANANDSFGKAVDLSNNRAVLGAYLDDDLGINSGSAYIINFDLIFINSFE